MKIVIVDYGMGNIWSVLNALHYLGFSAVVSSGPSVVQRADKLILPGVGSFRLAMTALRDRKLDHAISEAVQGRQRDILGICLGMQLLGASGSEDGLTTGLSLIPAPVDRFTDSELVGRKIPHVGFNEVTSGSDSLLLRGLPSRADFYFVHSYRMLPHEIGGIVSCCHYGVDFVAAYECDNIFATQFHPEKSQTNGLVLLKNFMSH